MRHGLSGSEAFEILPGSGVEPVSPAPAGRFFTTEPPGKSPVKQTICVVLGNKTCGNLLQQPQETNEELCLKPLPYGQKSVLLSKKKIKAPRKPPQALALSGR